MASQLLCNIFWHLEQIVRAEMQKVDRYCWFLENYGVWLERDKRLAPKYLYYFEDVIITFESVIQTDDHLKWSKEYRLDVKMVYGHVMLPGK